MNDSFEDQLRQKPLRKCPAEWRNEILSTLELGSQGVNPQNASVRTPWFLLFLGQRRYHAIGLIWLVILLLRLTEPTLPEVTQTTAQHHSPDTGRLLVAVIEQHLLERSPSQPPTLPSPTKPSATPPTRLDGPRSHLNIINRARTSKA